ncbi:MAG: response regulator [Candidatus Aminicenantes bacterium]|nr:response regulator [Candidatus Aminicenantes bacterium]
MPLKAPKILIIDDDPDFIEAVTPILKSALYDVASVLSPAEVKEKIFGEKPDLIILDIMMDSLFDGFSICHAVKTAPEYQAFHNVPILMISAVKEITGTGFPIKKDDPGMAGPDEYMDKPVKPAELLAKIEGMLKLVS